MGPGPWQLLRHLFRRGLPAAQAGDRRASGHRRPGRRAGARPVAPGLWHLRPAAELPGPRAAAAPAGSRRRADHRPASGRGSWGDETLRSVSLCYRQRRCPPCERSARGHHHRETPPAGAHAASNSGDPPRFSGPGRHPSDLDESDRPANPDAGKERASMEEKPTMDSKFRRVLVAAGRAEQLMRGARPKVEAGKRKPTRIALEEVDQSLIDWGYGPAPQPVEAEAPAAEEPQPAEVH